ncbi:hypothetical protein [Vibrio sp. SCSIO 43136]|nr:hypothetical protein [Vibrio sp. SCSIO 43136]
MKKLLLPMVISSLFVCGSSMAQSELLTKPDRRLKGGMFMP